ncbi:hypothetical protein PG995_015442 [Apiospora arundinis]|uniref:DUF1742-domain-containing protein n=1 Tax=Apiospora arundinis TaxID=335852 RepID=A0ABR2IFK2_9PEZI
MQGQVVLTTSGQLQPLIKLVVATKQRAPTVFVSLEIQKPVSYLYPSLFLFLSTSLSIIMSLPNVWHHRKVADSSAKGCDLCYKPTTSVLVTPDKQDHFYICQAHLKEVRFCKPIVDQAAEAAKKQKEKDDAIIAQAKKEYDEKQRKKKEAEKSDNKDSKDKDKAKDDKVDEEKKDDSKSKDKDQDKAEPEKSPQDEEPRVFELQRTFYQQRLTKKRQAEERKRQVEMSQRNRERLSNPSFFPAVPKDNP